MLRLLREQVSKLTEERDYFQKTLEQSASYVALLKHEAGAIREQKEGEQSRIRESMQDQMHRASKLGIRDRLVRALLCVRFGWCLLLCD